MSSSKKKLPAPPAINPYIFTFLLAFFGVWCFYDGWLTTDTKMLEHALFNQVLSVVLLPWSVYDFYKLRKSSRKNSETESKLTPNPEQNASLNMDDK